MFEVKELYIVQSKYNRHFVPASLSRLICRNNIFFVFVMSVITTRSHDHEMQGKSPVKHQSPLHMVMCTEHEAESQG